MSVITWPLALPQAPLAQPYAEEQQDGRIEFKTNSGPSYVRNMGLMGEVRTIHFRMYLDELAIFKRWVRETLMNATLVFEWADPATGEVLEVRFVPGKAPFNVVYGGPGWRTVSMQWEVMP